MSRIRFLLLQIELTVESILVEIGITNRRAEIAGKIPNEVSISGMRFRKSGKRCGLIGFARVKEGLSKVTLQATFFDAADKRCDYQERTVLVTGGAKFHFSFPSGNADARNAQLHVVATY